MTGTQRDQFSMHSLPQDLDTPALVVDVDCFERNLKRMATFMAERDIHLRPHAKTHSSSRVAQKQLAYGAQGLTVGTLRMAEALANAGADDLFVAAPVWPNARESSRIRALHEAITLTLAVDSVAAVDAIGHAVDGARVPLQVLVEIDSGEARSGVDPSQVVGIVRAASRHKLRVCGAFTHGGHSYARPGAAPAAAQDEVRVLEQAGANLAEAGVEVEILSAGSTPTVRRSAVAPVSEERPGTYVFNDRQQVQLGGAQPGDIALVVAATVTSTAVPGQVILNAGAKALSKDRADWLEGFGILPAYPEATIVRLYDFHAVAAFPDGANRPAQGETVAIVPNHVCPVVNLGRELVVVSKDRVVDTWPIDARG